MLYLKIILPFSRWAVRKAEQARDNLKMLGWFWGGLCALISGIIFYSPAIYLLMSSIFITREVDLVKTYND
jgi:hypothetical protein